jgi:hypothetical protein
MPAKALTPTLRQRYMSEYRAYCNAKERCQNPEHQAAKNYHFRGIKFEFESFAQFMQVMGPRPEKHDLDRKDNDGPYSPENCCWVTRKQNLRNQRKTRMITYRGETKPLVEWAEYFGLNENTVKARFYRYKLSLDRVFGQA